MAALFHVTSQVWIPLSFSAIYAYKVGFFGITKNEDTFNFVRQQTQEISLRFTILDVKKKNI